MLFRERAFILGITFETFLDDDSCTCVTEFFGSIFATCWLPRFWRFNRGFKKFWRKLSACQMRISGHTPRANVADQPVVSWNKTTPTHELYMGLSPCDYTAALIACKQGCVAEETSVGTHQKTSHLYLSVTQEIACHLFIYATPGSAHRKSEWKTHLQVSFLWKKCGSTVPAALHPCL